MGESKHLTGVLLVNLGTPDAPTPEAVRRYLREFLSDPRVIDLPPIPRWLLLNLVILPTRPRKSAAAYQKIWTAEGSPLLVHCRALTDAVAKMLGEGFKVELAMRYGSPTVREGIRKLLESGSDSIILAPLYPQYASSSTGSTLAAVYQTLSDEWNVPRVTVIPPFFNDAGFLDAWRAVAGPVLQSFQPEHVLFSFHGLPERQIRKSDPTREHCLANANCCSHLVVDMTARAEIHGVASVCYRAQCFYTAAAMAGRLGLNAKDYSISFQSRLGRTKWIEPYTDRVLPELARRGIRRLAVLCPAFVADCLETLEEIEIRGRESFLQAGGEDFRLVPSLNAHPAWTAAVVNLLESSSRAGQKILPAVSRRDLA